MKWHGLPFIVIAFLGLGCANTGALHRQAQAIADEEFLIDTHVDVPYRLLDDWEDISRRTARGNFDYVRAREGGLDAVFVSVYVPAEKEKEGMATAYADTLIDMVEKIAADHPAQFVMTRSVSDVTSIAGTGRMAFCLGMENGAPVAGELRNLKYFYDRGIRYITLTHSADNHISDSSYDTTRTWKGLSPFGKTLIAEMNRLGMLVDISHVSDSAFYQVLRLSKTPVIASHSSCRHFTPGWERNLSDDMIRELACGGGVIMINFGSTFLTKAARDASTKRRTTFEHYLADHHLAEEDSMARAFLADYEKQHPLPFADVRDVVDHIDHVVRLVGVDYVGFGSDFDGVGDSLPVGLKDVSGYPAIIFELLRRGYSRENIRKICGQNFLRVWSQVETYARNHP